MRDWPDLLSGSVLPFVTNMFVRFVAACALGLVSFFVAVAEEGAVSGAKDASAYLGPVDVAISGDERTLFVLEQDAKRLDAVDTRSGQVIGSISLLESLPHSVKPWRLAWFPDKDRLAITAGDGMGCLLIVTTTPLKVSRSIRLGHSPRGVAVAPDGKRVYVADRFMNAVRVVDADQEAEVACWKTGREPISVALTPNGKTLVVANHQPSGPSNSDDIAGEVSLIDTASGRSDSVRLPMRAMNVRDVAVTRDGRWALVTHILPHQDLLAFQNANGWTNSNSLSIIDVANRRRLNTLVLDAFGDGVGNPWGLSCTSDGKAIVICLAGTNEIAILDVDVIRREVEEPSPEAPLEYGTSNYTSNLEAYMRRVRLPIAGVRRAVASSSEVFAVGYFDDAIGRIGLKRQKVGEASVGLIRLGPPPVLSKVRRGEKLFHDALISRFNWQSCVSCHPDARSDGLNWDLLNDGVGNPKNTKSMLLSHKTPPAMISGVRATAEVAVRAGLHHILFAEETEEHAKWIDAYLKSLTPVPSPRLVEGALSESAERGKALFHAPDVGCAVCHPAPLYTDGEMHNVGTRGEQDYRGTFDTPTLIETWRTAPYLHDGRYATMEELFREGKHGGAKRIDRLSDQDLSDLVEFVLSL